MRIGVTSLAVPENASKKGFDYVESVPTRRSKCSKTMLGFMYPSEAQFGTDEFKTEFVDRAREFKHQGFNELIWGAPSTRPESYDMHEALLFMSGALAQVRGITLFVENVGDGFLSSAHDTLCFVSALGGMKTGCQVKSLIDLGELVGKGETLRDGREVGRFHMRGVDPNEPFDQSQMFDQIKALLVYANKYGTDKLEVTFESRAEKSNYKEFLAVMKELLK